MSEYIEVSLVNGQPSVQLVSIPTLDTVMDQIAMLQDQVDDLESDVAVIEGKLAAIKAAL
jgi:hypothetical protein